MNKVSVYQKQEEIKSQTDRNLQFNSNNKTESNKKCNYQKIILRTASIFFALICILIIVLLFIYKPWKKNKNTTNNPPFNETIIQNELNYEEFKNELIFTTKVNDLRRISINQSSYESMIIDGIESTMKSRITNYDIYILSEKKAEEESKIFFNKTYTASVSVVSQCLSKAEEKCDLKEYVDLSKNVKTNLRNLKELSDLKDIPVLLCLFNFTDTNIITSISCPDSLPESIKNGIISDLKLFRPAIKASSNKKNEMNLAVLNSTKNLRRKSKGLCDIENEMDSFCNSDSNITKNSEGYLLSFNEKSFINITTNEKNSLKINKTTNLEDETAIISLNPNKYKEVLDDILLKLSPYINNEEIISIEKAAREYNSKLLIDRKDITRHLSKNDEIYNNIYIGEESLFSKDFAGARINLNLKIDSGLSVETIKSLLNLNYNSQENQLVNVIQFSDFDNLLKKLISLSNSGNYMAYQLYKHIKNNLDDLTKQITIDISNLNSFIVYKDLAEIFDSSSSLNSLKILPFDIIEESNKLVDNLEQKIAEIDEGEFKNYSFKLQNNINDFFEEKLNLINDTFNNLNNLKNLLQSPKNKFTEISTYYLK